MARRGTRTFIVEWPPVASARDEREMLVLLEFGRQPFNACLGEATWTRTSCANRWTTRVHGP